MSIELDIGAVARRLRAISNELVSSEELYLLQLRALRREYAEPLSHYVPTFLHPSEYALMFGSLESFLNLSHLLISEFALQPIGDGSVFTVLKTFIPYFALYSNYVIHHAARVEVVSMFEQRLRVSISEKDKRGHQWNVSKMLSLMISPVQRIPRYRLLVLEMLRALPASYRGQNMLQQTAIELSQMVQFLNTSISTPIQRHEVRLTLKHLRLDSSIPLKDHSGQRLYMKSLLMCHLGYGCIVVTAYLFVDYFVLTTCKAHRPRWLAWPGSKDKESVLYGIRLCASSKLRYERRVSAETFTLLTPSHSLHLIAPCAVEAETWRAHVTHVLRFHRRTSFEESKHVRQLAAVIPSHPWGTTVHCAQCYVKLLDTTIEASHQCGQCHRILCMACSTTSIAWSTSCAKCPQQPKHPAIDTRKVILLRKRGLRMPAVYPIPHGWQVRSSYILYTPMLDIGCKRMVTSTSPLQEALCVIASKNSVNVLFVCLRDAFKQTTLKCALPLASCSTAPTILVSKTSVMQHHILLVAGIPWLQSINKEPWTPSSHQQLFVGSFPLQPLLTFQASLRSFDSEALKLNPPFQASASKYQRRMTLVPLFRLLKRPTTRLSYM